MVAPDGKDGHEIKIKKIGPSFFKCITHKNIYFWLVLPETFPDKMCLLISSSCPACNSAGTIFYWVKTVSNDLNTELT